jgi:glycopeptide antibiotics resistance protein
MFFGWLIALNILQIVWRCIELGRGTWERPSRVQQIVFKIVGLIPVLILLTAPGQIYISLKNPAVDQLRYGHNLEQVNKAIHLGFSVICAIVVLQLFFDIGKWAWEAHRDRVAAAI